MMPQRHGITAVGTKKRGSRRTRPSCSFRDGAGAAPADTGTRSRPLQTARTCPAARLIDRAFGSRGPQIAQCKALFTRTFGGSCTLVVGAPGRVNLIGEHTGMRSSRYTRPAARTLLLCPSDQSPLGSHGTCRPYADYNEGFVMPFCIGRYTVIAARKTAGARCRVASVSAGGGSMCEFPGDATLAPAPAGDWTNYMCATTPGAPSAPLAVLVAAPRAALDECRPALEPAAAHDPLLRHIP